MKVNGKVIRRMMRDRNMSQLGLAWFADVNVGLLGVILAGGECPMEVAEAIAGTLCVDIEEIAEDENG